MDTRVLVISTSLNPGSRSKILAEIACQDLGNRAEVDFLDLREVELPMCDGEGAYEHENIPAVRGRIAAADVILLALPVYNYAAGATAKNLIELTGDAWTDKVVGFLCAAGGKSSYMAVMGLANSLMLDFRCLICPRFVYADGGAYSGDNLTDQTVRRRIDELCRISVELASALKTPLNR